MSDLAIPTDSVLRRHFEQRAMSLGLPAIPEESVLRRHYLQRLAAALDAPSVGVVAAVTARAAPERTAAPKAQPREPALAAVADAGARSRDEPTSWFGRLLRKLGGG